jgi:pyruvyltransferase
MRIFTWIVLVLGCAAELAGMTVYQRTPPTSLPLYYWRQPTFVNFGDYLSLELVQRIVGRPVRVYSRGICPRAKKLLALGSILSFAEDGDVVWGSGINGKLLSRQDYRCTQLDVRAVRGPLTRHFLIHQLGIDCPEVYGDPALLFPYLFPEFQKKEAPAYDYVIIPHYSEVKLFPREEFPNVVYPTEPWNEVVEKILDSRFVISSSLHGIVLAEAYGIPARLLKITSTEPLFKYHDYYLGTNRSCFRYATSIEEALSMGGEPPAECDVWMLYRAFPFDCWPNAEFEFPSR